MLEKLFELGEQPYSEADAEWDSFVSDHARGSVLQMTNWARLKNRFGWSSQRVWLRREGALSAGAQILFRSAAFGLLKIGYIPHGPLVDWADDEQVRILFNQIDLAAYRHRAGILKVEPMLWQDELGEGASESVRRRIGREALAGDTIQPPKTIELDLRPPCEQIMAQMKSKTRYNIRLAARRGVTVRQGNLDDIEAFNRLMRDTGVRDGFGVHAPEYYRAAFELFQPHSASLHIAEFEGQPLSAVMVFINGTRAAYLYGASSNRERNRMPSYAAQWAAMRWAKDRGCTSYDFWGIPDAPDDQLEADLTNRSDGLWGVYRFKRGFGGVKRRTIGTLDRVYNEKVYKLYHWRRRRSGR
jgi:lipid II:glycine glycyltransferase (peptidoglycan interpeptide bridge formation enzyme)